jgi:hypothetical protein
VVAGARTLSLWARSQVLQSFGLRPRPPVNFKRKMFKLEKKREKKKNEQNIMNR